MGDPRANQRPRFGFGQLCSGHSQPSTGSSLTLAQAMTGENRQLVTNKPVEFEKQPVDV